MAFNASGVKRPKALGAFSSFKRLSRKVHDNLHLEFGQFRALPPWWWRRPVDSLEFGSLWKLANLQRAGGGTIASAEGAKR